MRGKCKLVTKRFIKTHATISRAIYPNLHKNRIEIVCFWVTTVFVCGTNLKQTQNFFNLNFFALFWKFDELSDSSRFIFYKETSDKFCSPTNDGDDGISIHITSNFRRILIKIKLRAILLVVAQESMSAKNVDTSENQLIISCFWNNQF